MGALFVTLPSAVTVLQITAGYYRVMGVTDLIADDVGDYVAKAVRLASDPAWREDVRARVCAARPMVHERMSVVRDYEALFERVATRPADDV